MMGLERYLERAGGLDLLLLLEEKGATFSDLEDQLTVSTSTLNKRLKEAAGLELIEKNLGEEDEVLYTLTGRGETVCNDLPFDKEEYQSILDDIKEKKHELKRLRDNLEEFKHEGAAVVEISDSTIESEGDINIKAEKG